MIKCRICQYLPECSRESCFHNTTKEEVDKLFNVCMEKVPEMKETIIKESMRKREYYKTYRMIKKIIKKER